MFKLLEKKKYCLHLYNAFKTYTKENREMSERDYDEIGLYTLYRVFAKRVKLIGGIFVFAVFSAGIASFLMKPVYRSSFTVTIPIITHYNAVDSDSGEMKVLIAPAEIEQLIRQLNNMAAEHQYAELSHDLGMREEKTVDIVSLQAKSISIPQGFVEIIADIHDPSLTVELKNSILQFLNQSSTIGVNEKISHARGNLTFLRDEIQAAIKDVEKQKQMFDGQIRQNATGSIGFNPIEFRTGIIKLKQKLRMLNEDIKSPLRGINVLAEPVVSQRPIKPRIVLNIALAGIASLFLGMFLALFLEWIEKNRDKASSE